MSIMFAVMFNTVCVEVSVLVMAVENRPLASIQPSIDASKSSLLRPFIVEQAG
jgi:hypothetical protein